MKNNPIIILLGEPNSVFSEILFKTYKSKNGFIEIYTLQNKHRVSSIDELIKIKENLILVVDGHQDIDQEIKDLKSSKDILLSDLISRANLIHKKRYSVKNDFEKLLNQNLSELGMNNSEIKIDLSKTQSIQKNGFSEGRFLLKSNKNPI